ncbi:DNA mismatch repair endonuclease MutL [Gehongia tenuis]|uniref:DNA mismatch repair protein MutL n=1 Tax=Gehongia tenuis TaxID=2763655 RepID=A0A926HP21_9FIRM|nr:DNA mismatch repair endonuclease MutL [Gehongia tenuis]MBC8531214.1 DNA mismatch repair endonuclease MutL [Gehongia tenuis]
MQQIIHILSTQTANQIAAGEVVERPASVAKELMENALDAGATAITLEIREGGIEYLRVTDNGWGIPQGEVPKAFLRHATSKIESENDLMSIATLGFRGEALASIASVSRLTLLTRTKDGETGFRYALEGGEIKDEGPVGCPVGTAITVEDLFFNTPARRKFLKKPSAEATAVCDLAQRLILSHPEVAFRVVTGGKTLYQSYGDGDLKNAIYVVYGKNVFASLMKVDETQSGVRVEGYVGGSDIARGNRTHQTFFINGRYVRSALLSQALEAAYQTHLTINRYPFCVLNIRLPLDQVDVNVHPGKLEVRFKDERFIREMVMQAVRKAIQSQEPLAAAMDRPAFGSQRYDREQPKFRVAPPTAAAGNPKNEAMLTRPKDNHRSTRTEFKTYNIQTDTRDANTIEDVRSEIPIRILDTLMQPLKSEMGEAAAVTVREAAEPLLAPLTAKENLFSDAPHRLIGQAFLTYLIVEKGDYLYIIDQHAAHERILYEKFTAEMAKGSVDAQPLLVPYILELSAPEKSALEENLEDLRGIGYDLEEFGPFSYRVTAIPALLGEPPLRELFYDVLAELMDSRRPTALEIKRSRLITLSCKKAIKGGDSLSRDEVNYLMDLVLSEKVPLTCPHGRPILTVMTRTDIEKKFKRIQ